MLLKIILVVFNKYYEVLSRNKKRYSYWCTKYYEDTGNLLFVMFT